MDFAVMASLQHIDEANAHKKAEYEEDKQLLSLDELERLCREQGVDAELEELEVALGLTMNSACIEQTDMRSSAATSITLNCDMVQIQQDPGKQHHQDNHQHNSVSEDQPEGNFTSQYGQRSDPQLLPPPPSPDIHMLHQRNDSSTPRRTEEKEPVAEAPHKQESFASVEEAVTLQGQQPAVSFISEEDVTDNMYQATDLHAVPQVDSIQDTPSPPSTAQVLHQMRQHYSHTKALAQHAGTYLDSESCSCTTSPGDQNLTSPESVALVQESVFLPIPADGGQGEIEIKHTWPPLDLSLAQFSPEPEASEARPGGDMCDHEDDAMPLTPAAHSEQQQEDAPVAADLDARFLSCKDEGGLREEGSEHAALDVSGNDHPAVTVTSGFEGRQSHSSAGTVRMEGSLQAWNHQRQSSSPQSSVATGSIRDSMELALPTVREVADDITLASAPDIAAEGSADGTGGAVAAGQRTAQEFINPDTWQRCDILSQNEASAGPSQSTRTTYEELAMYERMRGSSSTQSLGGAHAVDDGTASISVKANSRRVSSQGQGYLSSSCDSSIMAIALGKKRPVYNNLSESDQEEIDKIRNEILGSSNVTVREPESKPPAVSTSESEANHAAQHTTMTFCLPGNRHMGSRIPRPILQSGGQNAGMVVSTDGDVVHNYETASPRHDSPSKIPDSPRANTYVIPTSAPDGWSHWSTENINVVVAAAGHHSATDREAQKQVTLLEPVVSESCRDNSLSFKPQAAVVSTVPAKLDAGVDATCAPCSQPHASDLLQEPSDGDLDMHHPSCQAATSGSLANTVVTPVQRSARGVAGKQKVSPGVLRLVICDEKGQKQLTVQPVRKDPVSSPPKQGIQQVPVQKKQQKQVKNVNTKPTGSRYSKGRGSPSGITEYVLNLYYRDVHARRMREERAAAEIKERKQAELKECTFKPQVSPGSKKLLQRMPSEAPYLCEDACLQNKTRQPALQDDQADEPGPTHHDSPQGHHQQPGDDAILDTAKDCHPCFDALQLQLPCIEQSLVSSCSSSGHMHDRDVSVEAHPISADASQRESSYSIQEDVCVMHVHAAALQGAPDASESTTLDGCQRGRDSVVMQATAVDASGPCALLAHAISASPSENNSNRSTATQVYEMHQMNVGIPSQPDNVANHEQGVEVQQHRRGNHAHFQSAQKPLAKVVVSKSVSIGDTVTNDARMKDTSIAAHQAAHDRLYKHALLLKKKQEAILAAQAAQEAAARQFRARSPGRAAQGRTTNWEESADQADQACSPDQVATPQEQAACTAQAHHATPTKSSTRPAADHAQVSHSPSQPNTHVAVTPSHAIAAGSAPSSTVKQAGSVRNSAQIQTILDEEPAFDEDPLFEYALTGVKAASRSRSALHSGSGTLLAAATSHGHDAASGLDLRMSVASKGLLSHRSVGAVSGAKQTLRSPAGNSRGREHAVGSLVSTHPRSPGAPGHYTRNNKQNQQQQQQRNKQAVDWDAFIDRQYSFKAETDVRVESNRKQDTERRQRSRSLSPGSYRILTAKLKDGQEYVPPQERPLVRPEDSDWHWLTPHGSATTGSRSVMTAQSSHRSRSPGAASHTRSRSPGCETSFRPQITAKAARLPGSTVDQLYDGGRAAKQAWVQAVQGQRAEKEAAQQYGKIKYQARPSPWSIQQGQQRPSLLNPDEYLAVMATRRRAIEERAAAVKAQREAQALDGCTFKPQTTPLPAYLARKYQPDVPSRSSHQATPHSQRAQQAGGTSTAVGYAATQAEPIWHTHAAAKILREAQMSYTSDQNHGPIHHHAAQGQHGTGDRAYSMHELEELLAGPEFTVPHAQRSKVGGNGITPFMGDVRGSDQSATGYWFPQAYATLATPGVASDSTRRSHPKPTDVVYSRNPVPSCEPTLRDIQTVGSAEYAHPSAGNGVSVHSFDERCASPRDMDSPYDPEPQHQAQQVSVATSYSAGQLMRMQKQPVPQCSRFKVGDGADFSKVSTPTKHHSGGLKAVQQQQQQMNSASKVADLKAYREHLSALRDELLHGHHHH